MSLFRPIVTKNPADMERSMRHVQNAMNSMFGDILVGIPDNLSLSSQHTSGFSPRLDIYETDKEFDIKADLPGLSKDSVKLEVRDDCLWLSGETRKDSEKNQGTIHVRERFRGSFQRSIALPPTADTDKVDAKFDNGVLTVSIPKKSPTESGAKVINIQ